MKRLILVDFGDRVIFLFGIIGALSATASVVIWILRDVAGVLEWTFMPHPLFPVFSGYLTVLICFLALWFRPWERKPKKGHAAGRG